jgi:hypothetical protein
MRMSPRIDRNLSILAVCAFILTAVTSLALDAKSCVFDGGRLSIGSAREQESLSTELTRRQKQNGLTLISLLWSKVYTVDFVTHSLSFSPILLQNLGFRSGTVSPDGNQAALDSCGESARLQELTDSEGNCVGRSGLATASLDGSSLRTFPGTSSPFGICWSPDASRFAFSGGLANGLEIVDAHNGSSQSIDETEAFFAPQCWSHDGNLVAYTRNEPMKQTVVIYNLDTKKKTELSAGGYANWIPGTDWITFKDCGIALHRCTYYKVKPDGTGKRILFKTLAAASPLSWSSDGRLAAFVSAGRPTEPAGISWRLRVWRISDGSEVWVSNLSETDPVFFQWIAIPRSVAANIRATRRLPG